MLTAVERVLILKGADLLKDVGPRHLLRLANVAQEIEIFEGDVIYDENDPADALYIVVEGRVRLTTDQGRISEVGARESFGTWSLVDDSERKHRAECIEDGLTLALRRDDFYDVAAGDVTLLLEIIRALAKRLRDLVVERPEEARVEGEGIEKPKALEEEEQAAEALEEAEANAPATPGEALKSAVLGQPAPPGEPPVHPIDPEFPAEDIRIHEETDESAETAEGRKEGKKG
jgi:CRP-like cAMP-binding protein